jgi:cyanate lyase
VNAPPENTSSPTAVLGKTEAGRVVARARVRAGRTWAELADAIDRPPVWTVAALLGQHPVPAAEAETIGALLDLPPDVVEALQMQPYRGDGAAVAADPTIYRFHEALAVYGPAIKELIHEQFGDGIMSAINFKVSVERRADPGGDRVVVTFDGKFLDYNW